MEKLTDVTILQRMHDVFWQKPFYLVLYLLCLVSLILFWKTMERGRRLFVGYSLLCLVVFIYNPVFVNLCEQYLLRGDRVIIRVFLILPLLYTEAYVLANIVSQASKKYLSIVLTIVISSMLVFFGNTPNHGAKEGNYYYDTPMIISAENVYKIPQEHIDLTEAILNDMDGERSTLSMYEIHGINDVGGTLNFSIRMYTSRIQLDSIMDYEEYSVLSSEDRNTYWDYYIDSIRDNTTNNSSCYFLFPLGDDRINDLIDYGCEYLYVDSSNYCILEYTL